MRWLAVAALLTPLSVSLAANAFEPQRSDEAPVSTRDQKVGAAVGAALTGAPRVRVLVFFSTPSQDREALAEKAARISMIRDQIIAAIPPAEIDLHRSYQVVPAFAASISRSALDRLAAHPAVERIDVERKTRSFLAEVVSAMGADRAHALLYTGKNTVVAVIDSGIDTNHPDLADDLIAEACFCDVEPAGGPCCPNGQTTQFGPGSAEDDEGHGTHVTGVITSAGSVAPKGVAPDAGIIAIKYSTDTGVGAPQGTASDLIASLGATTNNGQGRLRTPDSLAPGVGLLTHAG